MSVPSGNSSSISALAVRAMEVMRELSVLYPHWEDSILSRMRVEEDGNGLMVKLRVEAPPGTITVQDRDALAAELTESFGRPVRVQIRLLEYNLLQDQNSPMLFRNPRRWPRVFVLLLPQTKVV